MYKSHEFRLFHPIDVEENLELLYVTVYPGISKGLLGSKNELDVDTTVNLGIFNLKTAEFAYLFNEQDGQKIEAILFEISYSKRDKKINFNTTYTGKIINNTVPEAREISNRLFVVRESKRPEEKEFWSFSKQGGEGNLLRKLRPGEEWRIDAKNQQAIFIKREAGRVVVERLSLL